VDLVGWYCAVIFACVVCVVNLRWFGLRFSGFWVCCVFCDVALLLVVLLVVLLRCGGRFGVLFYLIVLRLSVFGFCCYLLCLVLFN